MFFFTVAAISSTEPEVSRLVGFGHGVRVLFLSA
jgi:hypothetical protein